MYEKDGVILTEEEKNRYNEQIQSINSQMEEIMWREAGEPDEMDLEAMEEMYNNSPEVHLDMLNKEKEALEEIMFKDAYYRNLNALKFNIDYASSAIGKILVDDFPEHDLLGREARATQLADYICNESIKNSFNIGVLGEWGSGKSTFLNLIKTKLNEKKQKNTIVEISYDASSYSDRNQIWSNFAKILFEKYEQDVMFPNIRYTLIKMWDNKKSIVSEFILNLAIFILLFFIVWGTKLSFSLDLLIGKFAGYGFSLVGVLLLVTQLIIPWGKRFLSATIPLSKKVISGIQLPSYLEVLGTRESVSKELEILFKAWIPKDNQKIVIFVDELDRSSEKGISEFFEAIQLFYNTKKIMFVFAIEYSHLRRVLAKNFDIKENIDIYTKNYLDKYVSITVLMDNQIDFCELIERLISEANVDGHMQIPASEIEQIQRCIKNIPYKYLTPRKIKKIVNLLFLLKSFCINNYENYKINFCELFTWVLLGIFYSDGADYAADLFTQKREYTPLKNILTNHSYKSRLEKLLDNNRYYLNLIENFSMHDIVIYNKISCDFSVLI